MGESNRKSHYSSPSWLTKGEGVIKPDFTGERLSVRNAIICYDDNFYPKLISVFGRKGSREAPGFNGSHEGRIIGDVAIFRAYPGAPASGMMMEEAIAAGAENILMLGLAGSISPKVRMGDLVIPTWAIREEGLSYHYLRPEVVPRPSPKLLGRLRSALEGVPHHEAGVWTTDAVFREVPSKLRRYAKAGALVVEMECSALMAIAKYRKVEFAALMTITDETFGREWRPGFDKDVVMRAWLVACEAAKRTFSAGRGGRG
ncbi:TPA: nucleoside phosphorylase [Thermoplasmata archaeon]|nr:nucleoside phosphorylase [Thermoplasmata archaeon]